MQDIERWLERHGLARYCTVFTDNELTLEVLPELTEDDLRELGLPMGPRKQILKLLRDGDAVCAVEPQGAPAPVLQDSRPGEAERRQLTVMFIDLVGSSALSEALDPEDYRDLLSEYQSVATAAINTHEGFIARYMGDGLLVYFGYPRARENDAERAVRASLDVVRDVGALKASQPLNVRIGIATGPVVVGDIVGEGASEEAAVLGESPNLAARLQAAAEPGTVLMSATTMALVSSHIVTEASAPLALKGFSQALVAHRAIRVRSRAEEDQTLVDTTPLVGRDVELAVCERAWSQALDGDGRALSILGEAGVGKSRLLRAFQQDLAPGSHVRVQWHCSPYHQTSANYPATDALLRSVRSMDDDGQASLNGLEQLLQMHDLEVPRLAPVLASLLGIDLEGRYSAPELTPEALRRQTTAAQVELLLAAAKHSPVLLVVEDLHWCDATTLDVLSEMVSALAGARVLLLLTARPGFEPPWEAQPNAQSHRISGLSRSETVALVAAIVEQQNLADTVVQQIAERTDGVPLFVEELTRNLLESGMDDGVPASLRDSLMARLDRLGAAKEIAQVASVIGRTFSSEALYALAAVAPGDGEAVLGQLVAAGLVHARRHGAYEFKHALVRDAAYDSMLRATRRELHGRYAAYLQDRGDGEHEPALLGQHYQAAELGEQAMTWWTRAGDRALARAAQPEAATHFSRAFELMEASGELDGREAEALSILWRLGQAQFGALGGAARDTLATFERAETLAARGQNLVELCRAYYGQWVGLAVGGQLAEALPIARKVEQLAASSGDAWARAVAARLLGGNFYMMGELEAGNTELHKVIAAKTVLEEGPGGFGHDPYHTAIATLALVEWSQGYPRTAASRCAELLDSLDPEAMNPNTVSYTLMWQMLVALLNRDQMATIAAHESLAHHTQRSGGMFWSYAGMWGKGGWLIREGRVEEGLEVVEQGRHGFEATGALQHTTVADLLIAEGHLAADDPQRALRVLDDAEALVNRTSQFLYAPDIHRLRGDTLAQCGERTRSEHSYRTAMEMAQTQGSKSFELRAANGLARLMQGDGRNAEALALLAPLHDWFSEGHEYHDLTDCAALLAQLRRV